MVCISRADAIKANNKSSLYEMISYSKSSKSAKWLTALSRHIGDKRK